MGCCFKENDKGKRYEGKKETNIKTNKITTREVKRDPHRKSNEIDESESKKLVDIEFSKAALKRNNDYRKLHGVMPLILDDYLYKMAFILAKQKLTEDTLKYNNLTYKNHDELGMNVFLCKKKLEGDKLMDKWYDEIKNYNFIEPNEFECVDFTQMIWKNSKNFGCGYYEVKEENDNNNNENQTKEYFYVALYYPAGNQPGEFKNNVLKKNKHQKKNPIVSSPKSIKSKNNSSKDETIDDINGNNTQKNFQS